MNCTPHLPDSSPQTTPMDIDTDDTEAEPFNNHLPSNYRDTHETISEFLQRLPPAEATSRTPPGQILPEWYWIFNPHCSTDPTSHANHTERMAFIQEGSALLNRFKQNLAKTAPGCRVRLRQALERDIWELAGKWKVKSGKWMLYPNLNEVNNVWRTVCEGVDANKLGSTAKVATQCGRAQDRLICVYTGDFTDVADVKRVLFALKGMGLVPVGGIKYKADAYTLLDIYGNNEYALCPTIYNSTGWMLVGNGG